MIVVIQCAASKRAGAGHLQTPRGKPILFVAKPGLAPRACDFAYARPDDDSGDGQSWRQVLLRYNEAPGNNPQGLLPAYELYAKETYRLLVGHFGINNVFVLSAGWGLINASFLTPAYDITFSAAAEPHKRRKKGDQYRDLQMLPADSTEEIVFLGGKDYLSLFCSLTSGLRCQKTVFYNSVSPPDAPGCSLLRFATTTRTNWHYECADRLINGSLERK
jgi:hypothetical protein